MGTAAFLQSVLEYNTFGLEFCAPRTYVPFSLVTFVDASAKRTASLTDET